MCIMVDEIIATERYQLVTVTLFGKRFVAPKSRLMGLRGRGWYAALHTAPELGHRISERQIPQAQVPSAIITVEEQPCVV